MWFTGIEAGDTTAEQRTFTTTYLSPLASALLRRGGPRCFRLRFLGLLLQPALLGVVLEDAQRHVIEPRAEFVDAHLPILLALVLLQ